MFCLGVNGVDQVIWMRHWLGSPGYRTVPPAWPLSLGFSLLTPETAAKSWQALCKKPTAPLVGGGRRRRQSAMVLLCRRQMLPHYGWGHPRS